MFIMKNYWIIFFLDSVLENNRIKNKLVGTRLGRAGTNFSRLKGEDYDE